MSRSSSSHSFDLVGERDLLLDLQRFVLSFIPYESILLGILELLPVIIRHCVTSGISEVDSKDVLDFPTPKLAPFSFLLGLRSNVPELPSGLVRFRSRLFFRRTVPEEKVSV